MCLECGTALNVSTSDVADQERDFIAELIAQGMTKEQVKAALVAEYGPRVLGRAGGRRLRAHRLGRADPRRRSPRSRSWSLVARRWRAPRPATRSAGAPPAAALDPDDARRLDAELAAFDR